MKILLITVVFIVIMVASGHADSLVQISNWLHTGIDALMSAFRN